MIPILTAAQIRAADEHTIASGTASLELMERAGKACATWILEQLRNGAFGDMDRPGCHVIMGMGNNGGDGAVIARELGKTGIPVRVTRIKHKSDPSKDNRIEFDRMMDAGIRVSDLEDPGELRLENDEIIIEAIFGTGLSKPLTGWLSQIVKQINNLSVPVIAIDMPAGLFADDNAGNDPTSIVKASFTLTFEVPKPVQLLPDQATFVGGLAVLPIGLDREFIIALPVQQHIVEESDVRRMLPPRPWNGHKGTFGHCGLIAGSVGKAGAAVMATLAALRSGCGLVTTHVPADILAVLQGQAPEAMCTINEGGLIQDLPDLRPYSAIGIGPGLGTATDTARMVKRLIQDAGVPLVFDADALNILSENRTWMSFLPKRSILTPHPKEFDRLFGETASNDQERLERAIAMAIKLGCVIVLKNSCTAICSPDGKVYYDQTGNPGMARGGSGDALTGLLTGLLAQRIIPLQAAITGVHLHGLAGDHAAAQNGMDGMTVMDLIAAIPKAWMALRNGSDKIFHRPFSGA